MNSVGVVVIGRNEGERLRRCLVSLADHISRTVYVDSGSSDGSVHLASALGARVHALDALQPFSAARARNEGFQALLDFIPGLSYVQFIDGDCALHADWLRTGAETLDARHDVAVVAGRLRETHIDASIYNRLCDIEWNTPVGEVDAAGGIAMMRATALRDAGGFDPTLIAGEEPELCLRLRRRGWKILRLSQDMARHDAAMTRFSQWWRRAVRAGHAYAEGAWLHGRAEEAHWVRETASISFWGAGLPLGIVAASALIHPSALLLVAGYPLLAGRVYRHMRSRGFSQIDSGLYAVSCVVAKFPQLLGVAKFHATRSGGRRRHIIEYK